LAGQFHEGTQPGDDGASVTRRALGRARHPYLWVSLPERVSKILKRPSASADAPEKFSQDKNQSSAYRLSGASSMVPGSVHTPETLKLLREALDDIWASLRPHERVRTSRTMIAVRLLEMAAAGERDPARLRSAALSTVVTSAL
jgi:hypothetical protein